MRAWMRVLMGLILGFGVFTAQSMDSDPICLQKKNFYGKNFVDCQVADFGPAPISASYQPTQIGGLAVPPENANLPGDPEYKNDFPHLKGTDRAFEQSSRYGKGIPLGQRFIEMMEARGEDPSAIQWLKSTWLPSNAPQPDAAAWRGKCFVWAGWSVDPEWLNRVRGIRSGVMCNDQGLTRGEIKELITSFYPPPVIKEELQVKFSGFADGGFAASDLVHEDANIALSKLGMLGSQADEPSKVIQNLKAGIAKGWAAQTNVEPSDSGLSSTWNQPVKKVIDVSYRAPLGKSSTEPAVPGSKKEHAGISLEQQHRSIEPINPAELIRFDQVLQGTEKLPLDSEFSAIEREMLTRLKGAHRISNSRLTSLCESLNTVSSSSALNCSQSLNTASSQVDFFNDLKREWMKKIALVDIDALDVVRHELIMQYGDENSFASNGPDGYVTVVYSYATIQNADGSWSHSAWTPRTNTLEDVCQVGNTGHRYEGGSASEHVVVRKLDLQSACKDPSARKNHRVFTAAVAPKDFRFFEKGANYGNIFNRQEVEMRKKALASIQQMIDECPDFSPATEFVADIQNASVDNVFDSSEISRLKARLTSEVKSFLDTESLKRSFGAVAGFDQLGV